MGKLARPSGISRSAGPPVAGWTAVWAAGCRLPLADPKNATAFGAWPSRNELARSEVESPSTKMSTDVRVARGSSAARSRSSSRTLEREAHPTGAVATRRSESVAPRSNRDGERGMAVSFGATKAACSMRLPKPERGRKGGDVRAVAGWTDVPSLSQTAAKLRVATSFETCALRLFRSGRADALRRERS